MKESGSKEISLKGNKRRNGHRWQQSGRAILTSASSKVLVSKCRQRTSHHCDHGLNMLRFSRLPAVICPKPRCSTHITVLVHQASILQILLVISSPKQFRDSSPMQLTSLPHSWPQSVPKQYLPALRLLYLQWLLQRHLWEVFFCILQYHFIFVAGNFCAEHWEGVRISGVANLSSLLSSSCAHLHLHEFYI